VTVMRKFLKGLSSKGPCRDAFGSRCLQFVYELLRSAHINTRLQLYRKYKLNKNGIKRYSARDFKTQSICAHKAARYHFSDPTGTRASQEAYFNNSTPTRPSDLDRIAVEADDACVLIRQKILNLGIILLQTILPGAQDLPTFHHGRIQRTTDDVDWNR
jgi:hypothetical protein